MTAPMMPGRAVDIVFAAFKSAAWGVYSIDVTPPTTHRPGLLTVCPSSSKGPERDRASYAALAALGASRVARTQHGESHDTLTSDSVLALPGWEIQVLATPTGPAPAPADADAVEQLIAGVDRARAEQDSEPAS